MRFGPREPLGMLDALAVVLLAGAYWIAAGASWLTPDAAFSLVWGDQVSSGHLPSYADGITVTPHPLVTALAAVVAPLGGSAAYDARLALSYVGLGAAVWCVLRIGAWVFGVLGGVAAAVVAGTTLPVFAAATEGELDVIFVGVVLLAVLLETQRPRRGGAVLVTLAAAGLIRPEAWLLSGLYFLWLWPAANVQARVRNGALAAAAPALWLGTDLWITGDLAFSFHRTRVVADLLGEPRGAAKVPRFVWHTLRAALGLPLLVVALAGAAQAVRRRVASAAAVGAALLASLATFVVVGLLGLSLIDRFLLLAALTLAVFCGAAVAAVAARPRGTADLVLGVVALALVVATLPHRVDDMRHQRLAIKREGLRYAPLRRLASRADVRALLGRCRVVSSTDSDALPIAAHFAGHPGLHMRILQWRPARRGALIVASDVRVGGLLRTSRAALGAPRGFARLAAAGVWSVYDREC
jgi:hypothetical protein